MPFVLCWKLEIKCCIAKKLLNSVLSHTVEAVSSAIFRWGGFQVLTVQFCGCIPRPGAITPANSRFAFLWNVSPQHGQKKPPKTLCSFWSEQILQSVYFWLETQPRHPVFHTQTPNLRSTRLFSLWRSLINQEAPWPPKEALSFPANTQKKKQKNTSVCRD